MDDDKEEKLKEYHYKKEGFVPKEENLSEEEIKKLKADLPGKFIVFKNTIIRLKKENLSIKGKEIIGMMEELAQRFENIMEQI